MSVLGAIKEKKRRRQLGRLEKSLKIEEGNGEASEGLASDKDSVCMNNQIGENSVQFYN